MLVSHSNLSSNIVTLQLNWRPTLPCIFLTSTTLDMATMLLRLKPQNPARKVRHLQQMKMAEVIVHPKGDRVQIPKNSLLTFLDGNSLIPFDCRMGSCGVCRIRVINGMENLEPPNERELILLKNAGKNERFACQARIKDGTVEIGPPCK